MHLKFLFRQYQLPVLTLLASVILAGLCMSSQEATWYYLLVGALSIFVTFALAFEPDTGKLNVKRYRWVLTSSCTLGVLCLLFAMYNCNRGGLAGLIGFVATMRILPLPVIYLSPFFAYRDAQASPVSTIDPCVLIEDYAQETLLLLQEPEAQRKCIELLVANGTCTYHDALPLLQRLEVASRK